MRKLTAVFSALVLLVAGCSTGTDAVTRGTNFEFVSPGGQVDITYEGDQRKPLPPLSGEDLMTEGKQISVSDFAGKVVVINLWGSWCPPCRTEAPELERVQREVPGVQVLGLDVREDNRNAPQDFVRDRGLTYPSIYDPPGRSLLMLKGYPRNAVPSTIVLDKQHRVAMVFLRGLLASDLIPVVQRLAAE
ncbi:TlpA family protein disulfide reductase [Amycolatopsis albispora]|uniref:Alkyl hydroperoxide reductase n=1 Tax=Amycolatopsis albispora TaxID=1804986 RepID=A0A344LF34_9PSEU|nr:TlpA disulfide reductase family protein [Amycolatopsis albispora]AXB46658.1 alkyl hydroperoxide reductase [Amycolatopsis albispora]